MPDAEDDELITLKDAAKRTGLPRQALYLAITNGWLFAVKRSAGRGRHSWHIANGDLLDWQEQAQRKRPQALAEAESASQAEPPTQELFFTIDVGAQVAEMKPATIRHAIESGQLPARKQQLNRGQSWVFRPADLFQWIDESTQRQRKVEKKRSGGFLQSFSEVRDQDPTQLARLLAAAPQANQPSEPVEEVRVVQGLFANHPGYTKCERVIMEWLAEGCKPKEMASWLVLSLSTVKGHVSNIYRKLGPRNRRQAQEALQTLLRPSPRSQVAKRAPPRG